MQSLTHCHVHVQGLVVTCVSRLDWLSFTRCTSVPGIGANYTFVVAVEGGVSNASTDALSYAPPVINSLSGPGASGADTAGGAVIFLNGSNFGPVDATTVVRAWSSPSVNDSLVFPGVNCSVVEAHVAIR